MSTNIFNNIPGYQRTKDVLSYSSVNQRVSHSYIFNSLDGLPAIQMALGYAQLLLCEESSESACGDCSGCKLVNQLNHPDLHFSFPFFKTGKKDVDCDLFMNQWREFLLSNPFFTKNSWRDLVESGNKQLQIFTKEGDRIIKSLSLKPFKGGYKVLVLWQPEALHNSAANKLLKFIEEPDYKTVVILVTHEFDSIIPTIRSRCQTFTFEPLETQRFKSFVKSLNIEYHDAFADLSEGNIGNYFRLLNNKDLDHDRGDKFITWLRYCYSRNVQELLRLSDEFSKLNREDQKNQISSFLELVRITFNYDYIEKGTGTLSDLSKLAPFITSTNAPIIEKELEALIFHLERNAKANLAYFDTSLKIITPLTAH